MSKRPSKYCRQREKGRDDRAYVVIDGKRHSLGIFGTAESKAKYTELLAKPVGPESVDPNEPATVSMLLVQFLEWANEYYDSREYGHFTHVAKILNSEAGATLAQDFGPKALKAVRDAMIAKGWTRKGINRQIVRVRQIFTWAVGEEIIPAMQLEALRAVRGLRGGRSDAVEKPPIEPVPEADFDATILELSPVVADMVRVHKLIGCRPAELVAMKPELIDRSGPVWIFTPESHKTAWRGKSRQIAIGPKAQEVLVKYLFGDRCFMSKMSTGSSKTYRVDSYRRERGHSCL